MNVIRKIFQEDITSALILEDDADWDVRIKTLLQDSAIATPTLTQQLTHPKSGIYADPTYPVPENASVMPDSDFLFHNLPVTVPSQLSPYGIVTHFFSIASN